jgi:type IV secretory pathway component VirB8
MKHTYRPVLPKLFSTATQFLEQKSIATHITLLDKKKYLKKYIFIIEYNFTKSSISHNEACVSGALVSGYC